MNPLPTGAAQTNQSNVAADAAINTMNAAYTFDIVIFVGAFPSTTTATTEMMLILPIS